MKIKRFYIILLCVVLSAPLFASGFGTERSNKFQPRIQENAQTWTQDTRTTSRGGAIDGSDMDQFNQQKDPSVPVGDTAWIMIVGMGIAYGVYGFSGRRKEVRE